MRPEIHILGISLTVAIRLTAPQFESIVLLAAGCSGSCCWPEGADCVLAPEVHGRHLLRPDGAREDGVST